MSRKRNRHQSLSGLLNRTTSSFSTEPKPLFGASMTKSFYIPLKTSAGTNLDMTDFHKDKVFSKYHLPYKIETYHFSGNKPTKMTQGCCTFYPHCGKTRQSNTSTF
jgi:hypothetical protein